MHDKLALTVIQTTFDHKIVSKNFFIISESHFSYVYGNSIYDNHHKPIHRNKSQTYTHATANLVMKYRH